MNNDSNELWTVQKRDLVFSARDRIKVFRETVILPDHQMIDDYYTISLPDFVEIVARDDLGRYLVLRQYKHGPRSVHFCLPAGHVEGGETPLQAAQRELLEETGYHSSHWRPLGRFSLAGNQGCGFGHAFACDQATQTRAACSGDLETASLHLIAPDELRQLVADGQFPEAGDLSALALAWSGG